MVRAKIQASQIINRLHKLIKGEVSMSPQAVTAAKILLDKSLPSLTNTELSGPGGGALTINVQKSFPDDAQ